MRGLWLHAGSGYIPSPGGIIFFDWNGYSCAQHADIVKYVESHIVRTVEGITGGYCTRRGYRLYCGSVLGY